MTRLRVNAHAIHPANGFIHAPEMIADRRDRDRTTLARRRFGKIRIAQAENHLRRRNLLIGGSRTARLAAVPRNLTALVEEILDPGSRREIAHELELVPKPVEFF